MKRTIVSKWVTSILLAITITLGANASAYMKIDGIDGEAVDKDHKGWSDIMTFEQGLRKQVASTGGKKGKRPSTASWSNVIVTKELDKSSPKMALAVASGRVIPWVVLDVTASLEEGGEIAYYRYELKNVQVTSYKVGGTHENMLPVESFSLNFEEIKVTYNSLDPNHGGRVSYGWDLVNNQPN
ncbi:type VI secretion system tube protein Hcp [bacterium]|jgi:type VI secretion system secreted protein Hcp|nr:type VI secretion system tube protein Hcp [bacterium]